MSSAPNPQSDADRLEAAADQAIAACGGDAREAVKALIVANQFLETELEKLRAAVSVGYARGKLSEAAKTVPRDRIKVEFKVQGYTYRDGRKQRN
jgi:hypothetical protein